MLIPNLASILPFKIFSGLLYSQALSLFFHQSLYLPILLELHNTPLLMYLMIKLVKTFLTFFKDCLFLLVESV